MMLRVVSDTTTQAATTHAIICGFRQMKVRGTLVIEFNHPPLVIEIGYYEINSKVAPTRNSEGPFNCGNFDLFNHLHVTHTHFRTQYATGESKKHRSTFAI